MKTLLGICLLAGVFINCQSTKPNLWADSEPFQQWCKTAFQSDSGFINTRQKRQLKILLCQNDTSIFTRYLCDLYAQDESMLHADTAQPRPYGGKYFREPLPDGITRWVLYFGVDLGWDVPFVFEILQQKNKFRVNSWAMYPHGNYACCWNGPTSGFTRLGPYFILETCGTGTGLCTGDANFLFFPLRNYSSEDTIPSTVPISVAQQYDYRESLTSKFTNKSDTLLADYDYYRDSLIITKHKEYIAFPLKHYRFQALFAIDTAARQVKMLNCKEVLQYKECSSIFYKFISE